MILQSTLDFLSNLKNNNSREWVGENIQYFMFAKSDILVMAQNLLTEISSFDNTISVQTDPKTCITNLNTDLWFYKNKTPYNLGYFIMVNKNGKKSSSAFYYLYIEPGNSFFGAGLWNPQPEELKKIRKGIAFFFDQWISLIKADKFKHSFPSGIQSESSLVTVPKDFDKNDPAAKFLKMKGYYTKEKLEDREVTNEVFFKKLIDGFKNAKPLVDFLNQKLEIA